MILKDPRNMNLEDIRKLLQHCYARQVQSGPGSAFRFALFIGPKRKQLFANYPDTSNTGGNQTEPTRRKKQKGKQRQDVLQGLLRIDESVEPPTPTTHHADQQHPSVAGPSNSHVPYSVEPQTSAASHQDAMVRIDMGQMLLMKDMGYEASGPVNGPNDGYPEYEVSKAVFDKFISSYRPLQSAPTPILPPMAIGPSGPDPELNCIDPALLGLGGQSEQQTVVIPSQATGQNLDPSANSNPPLASGSNVRPTTPPNNNAESVEKTLGNQNKTPKKRVGKRAQANLSPQTTRRNTKKKKVTDDDLAAIEAQKMVQSESKRRKKPTRRT
jgi:hypothetical protein